MPGPTGSARLYTDQHGRVFKSSVERMDTTMNPTTSRMYDRTGYLQPVGWGSPYPFWNLASDFVVDLPDDGNGDRVLLDYDGFIQRQLDDIAAWKMRGDQLMQAAARDTYRPGDPWTPFVLKQAGPKPKPWEPADACRRGNKWALKGEGECPKALEPFFVKPVESVPTFDEGMEDIYADPQVADAVEDAEAAQDREETRGERQARIMREAKANKSKELAVNGVEG